MISKVFIIGRICNDLELKISKDVHPYVQMTLAVNLHTKGRQHAMFHKCISFNKTAEYITKNSQKGDLVYAEGTLIDNTIRAYDAEGKELLLTDSIPCILTVKILSRPKPDEEFVIQEPFHRLQESVELPDIEEILHHV